MPSIHYSAQRIDQVLAQQVLAWLILNRQRSSRQMSFLMRHGYKAPRRLSKDEVRSIRKLSLELEKLTQKWIETANSTGECRKYYLQRRSDDYGPDEPKGSKGLRLYSPIEGLYHPGVYEEGEPPEESFFGYTNMDDVEANFNVIPFIEEYVRRLSGLITDLVWTFDYSGEAFYRGRVMTIKKYGYAKHPPCTAPRKDPIPVYVHRALSPSEIKLPYLRCTYCKKRDGEVTPQFIGKTFSAHESCLIGDKIILSLTRIGST